MKQKQWKETNFLLDALHSTLLTLHPSCPQHEEKDAKESSGKKNLKIWTHIFSSSISGGLCKAITSPRILAHPNHFDSREMSKITSFERRSQLVSLAVGALLFVLDSHRPTVFQPVKPNRIWNNLLKCSKCHAFLRCCFSVLIMLFAKKCFLFAQVRETRHWMQERWMAHDCVLRHILVE